MTVNAVRSMLQGSEGKRFRFEFLDGIEMLAKVVSATHVDLDDTVVLLRVGALPSECAWQVHLADSHVVSEP